MAAINPDVVGGVVTFGANVNEFSSGSPQRVNLTFVSSSDTYTHGVGVKTWACIPDTTDLQTVSYTASSRVFTLTSAAGVGKVISLIIWAAK